MSVLWLLTVSSGCPFVTLSATSPLLQAWYAGHSASPRVGRSVGRHPYRGYSRSRTLDRCSSLLIYPWLIEPRWSLREQTTRAGGGLHAFCRGRASAIACLGARCADVSPSGDDDVAAAAEASTDRVLWVGLAACGSLLLSAVTDASEPERRDDSAAVDHPARRLSVDVRHRVRRRPLAATLDHASMSGLAVLGSAGYLLYKGDLFMPIVPRRRASFARRCSRFACSATRSCIAGVRRRGPADDVLFLRRGRRCDRRNSRRRRARRRCSPAATSWQSDCVSPPRSVAATWAGWLASRVFWFGVTVAMLAVVVKQVRADRDNNILRVRNFYGTLHVRRGHDAALHATSGRCITE